MLGCRIDGLLFNMRILLLQEIRSEVEMKDNASPNLVVRYYTSCAGSLVQENNKCQGIEEGSTVDFTVNIEVRAKLRTVFG